jgi:phage tail sheath gpL-like
VATSRINPNSLAAATAIGAENVRFVDVTEVLPRKLLISAKYDKDKDDVDNWVPRLIRSVEEAGDLYGFGSEVYRLAKWAFTGNQSAEIWVSPDLDFTTNGTATYAYGSINITATGVLADTLHLYISGEYVPVGVNDDDTAEDIENAIVAAINNDKTLPITASTTTPTADQVNTKSKNRSVYGNYVKISFNEGYGQEFPVGVEVAIVQPTGGTGTINLEATLDALGLDDEQNENYYTDFIVSDPELSASILDAISEWNGINNDFVGNWGRLVQRPLRCLHGDTAAGTAGFDSLIALGDGRKDDRTNGVIAVPGSPNHPQEIAALALGITADINNRNPAQSAVNEILPGVWPGAPEDRWTSSYDSRDQAVKAGISPTVKDKSGAVKMQNLVTFYHPDNVPARSNGYRSMIAISKLQNITNSVRVTFEQEKWQGITIVQNVSAVTNIVARQKVKDKQAVENELISLARAWEEQSWIYSASFTIQQIRTGRYVQVRAGGTGFDVRIPIILSGEAWIIDTIIQFDTALTVFTQ